jgi:hypothetical protein
MYIHGYMYKHICTYIHDISDTIGHTPCTHTHKHMKYETIQVVLDRERWRELDILDAIEALPADEKSPNTVGLPKPQNDGAEILRNAMRKRIQSAYDV